MGRTRSVQTLALVKPTALETQLLKPLNLRPTIRAEIITYTILGVPCYNYSIMGPKALF